MPSVQVGASQHGTQTPEIPALAHVLAGEQRSAVANRIHFAGTCAKGTALFKQHATAQWNKFSAAVVESPAASATTGASTPSDRIQRRYSTPKRSLRKCISSPGWSGSGFGRCDS